MAQGAGMPSHRYLDSYYRNSRSMRALIDGIFEVEEGFREVENDEEFQYKPGIW